PSCGLVGFITQYWIRVPSGRVSQCSSGMESILDDTQEFRSVSWRIEPFFSSGNNSCGLGTPIIAATILPPPSPNTATPVGPRVNEVAAPPETPARASG